MTSSSKLRLWLVYGGAGVAVNAFVFVVTSRSNHVSGRVPAAALEVVIGLSFIGCGLLARSRRPENRIGLLLIANGFAWDAGTLNGANNATLYTAGNLLGALVLAVFAHLLLAYPSGELRNRLERRIIFSGYVLAVVANAVELPFDRHFRCDKCPTNVLFVTSSPRASSIAMAVADLLGLLLLGAVAVLVMRHWRAASTAARRGLGPILASGGAAILLIAISFAFDPVTHRVHDLLVNLGLLSFATVPFFFLAVLLRSRLAQAGVAELLIDTAESSSVAAAEARLQRVLGDPSLRLGVWFLERHLFVGADGEPFSSDTIESDRVSIGLEDELGRPLALLEHDRALLDQRELMEGAIAGARLALQRDRLQWELKMQLRELKLSRVRLVEAADTERRRLERNLHDGAQQRLVSLSLALRLAQSRLRSDPDGTEQLLAGAAEELQLALQELRELARGLHPAILADRGLAAALESLVERSLVPVELSISCEGRLAEPVEVAAFYVVSEALANVAKYAGATGARITVERTESTVELEIADDGVGGANPELGSGLRGLADRLDALDGRLKVISPPGGGTRVVAELPLVVHSPE